MTPPEFRQLLRDALADERLSRQERKDLITAVAAQTPDPQRLNVYRSIAFEVAREALTDPAAQRVLEWLEKLNKLLLPAASDQRPSLCEVHFTPGDACVRRITQLLR